MNRSSQPSLLKSPQAAAEDPFGTAPGPVLMRVNGASARSSWPAKQPIRPAARKDRLFMLLQLQANDPARNGFVTGGEEQGRAAIYGDEWGVAKWSERQAGMSERYFTRPIFLQSS